MSFGKNLANKYGRKLLNTATIIGIDALKTEIIKAAEETGKFIENKIANKIITPKPLTDENSRNVEDIIISPEQRKKY